MKIVKTGIFFTLLFCVILSSCTTPSVINDESKTPEGKRESRNIYAFIGEKVSIVEFDPNANQIFSEKKEKIFDEEIRDTVTLVHKKYIMDNGFRCKYKVIRNLYNNLEKDTIEFVAYDHYGSPNFAGEKSVILYLSKSIDGTYFFHQKYQYDKLFIDDKGNYFSYPRFNGDKDLQFALKNLQGFPAHFPNEKYRISHLLKFLKNKSRHAFFKIEGEYGIPTRGIYLNQLIFYRLNTTFIKH